MAEISKRSRRTRDLLRICADILSVARDGARKTHIMYKANLSYEMLNRYLELLKGTGLLMLNASGGFIPSEKGFTFLREYEELVRSADEYKARNLALSQLLTYK